MIFNVLLLIIFTIGSKTVSSANSTCPTFFLNANQIDNEPCTSCDLCGDGSICDVCTNPVALIASGICPDFGGSSGTICTGCDTCSDGSVCSVCPDNNFNTPEPTTISTPIPTVFSSSTGKCPPYQMSGDTITDQTCKGCELCGDGSLCPLCPNPIKSGVCPSVNGASTQVCTGCDSCSDGSICPACDDYYIIHGISHPPTLEPTVLETADCPAYNLDFVLTYETCSGCNICGDGSICSLCPEQNPTGICPDHGDVYGQMCTGCDSCSDGSICPVCGDYFYMNGLTYPPTFEPTIEPSAPTFNPTFQPSITPSNKPSSVPTFIPSSMPTSIPSSQPSKQPTFVPTLQPTEEIIANSASSSSFSTGAIAGIAVGFFALIVILFYFYTKRNNDTDKTAKVQNIAVATEKGGDIEQFESSRSFSALVVESEKGAQVRTVSPSRTPITQNPMAPKRNRAAAY